MTDAQTGLLRKARRTVQSARLLLADGDYDGAVSRAYYAMFYVAEALLLGKGLTFSKHAAVIAAFGKEFIRPGTIPGEYHRYLMEAQEARNAGDYQVVSHLTAEETLRQITSAEDFLAVGQRFLQENPGPSGSAGQDEA